MLVSTLLYWVILTFLNRGTFFPLVILAVLVWDIFALLSWNIVTISILYALTILIWYLGALRIPFLFGSVFSNRSTLRGIVPFAGSWIFHPNLLSWGWFFPMFFTSLFFLCEAFIFNIRDFDWSIIILTFLLLFRAAIISPGISTFLFGPVSTLLAIFCGTLGVCIGCTFCPSLASIFIIGSTFLIKCFIFYNLIDSFILNSTSRSWVRSRCTRTIWITMILVIRTTMVLVIQITLNSISWLNIVFSIFLGKWEGVTQYC